MTIWEGASFAPILLGRKRGKRLMTADSFVNHHPTHSPDYARYLVDVAVTMLKSLRIDLQNIGIEDLMWSDKELASFVAKTFRHSKVSYSVLLLALLYLMRIRHNICNTVEAESLARQLKSDWSPAIVCFIGSLIISNKFLHDRHAANSVWAIQTGIPLKKLNNLEMALLNLLEHKLFIDDVTFQKWTMLIFHPSNLAPYTIANATTMVTNSYKKVNQKMENVPAAALSSTLDHYNRCPEPMMTFMGYYAATS